MDVYLPYSIMILFKEVASTQIQERSQQQSVRVSSIRVFLLTSLRNRISLTTSVMVICLALFYELAGRYYQGRYY